MTETIFIEEGPSPRIYYLIKFVKQAHVDSFVGGRIRMGTVRSYREDYEGGPAGRNDPHEHLGSLFQPSRIVVSINGVIAEGFAERIEIRPDNDNYSYLLCMTAITDRNLNAAGGVLRLDSRLLGLGDAAVIVHNVSQFQQRLEAGIHANSFLQSHTGQNGRASGMVEYVDFKNHHGDLGPFRKSEDFKFQHEWRLALIDSREAPREDHIFLEIGDLSDIVSVMESATLLANEIRAEPR